MPLIAFIRRGGLLLAVAGILVGAACLDTRGTPGAEGPWIRLEEGLELGLFEASQPPSAGDGLIRILRIDPERFELKLLSATERKERPRTARAWCETRGMVAAINASMYQEDRRTSVSLMRSGDYVNNSHFSKDKTILAFDPLSSEDPSVKIVDRECEDFSEWKTRYRTFVQSIRMYSCKGENVWSPQRGKWSTAAIGTDRNGMVLFVHVRSAYTTHDLINMLSRLPIELDRLMYSEGGPEAQLFVKTGDVEHEFVGSFKSVISDDNDNRHAWPVPNVIAVSRR